MTEPDDELIEKKGVSRRNFMKGAVAGAVVGAVVVAGVEEGVRIPGLPKSAATTVTSTKTVTTTVTGTGTGTGTGTSTTPTGPVTSKVVTLTVNGNPQTLLVQANWSLLEVLREKLNLFSVHDGCSLGECGACTIMMDGMGINSCQILAIEAEGHQITTLEGISDYGNNLDPVQKAFIANQAEGCGYCTPGQIMQARALLNAIPKPTTAQIRTAMGGNLCICGVYNRILTAVASVGGSS